MAKEFASSSLASHTNFNIMRKGFSFTWDQGLKDKCENYCNRQTPRLSLANLIHRALFEFLAREDNQLEEVEK